eukprot:363163-Chlamydomonas_euryale.AAC.6
MRAHVWNVAVACVGGTGPFETGACSLSPRTAVSFLSRSRVDTLRASPPFLSNATGCADVEGSCTRLKDATSEGSRKQICSLESDPAVWPQASDQTTRHLGSLTHMHVCCTHVRCIHSSCPPGQQPAVARPPARGPATTQRGRTAVRARRPSLTNEISSDAEPPAGLTRGRLMSLGSSRHSFRS